MLKKHRENDVPTNRTGIVAMLDMFVLLFFTLAVLARPNTPAIWVSPDNPLDVEDGIFVAKSADPSWKSAKAFIRGQWVDVDLKASWASIAVATECNLICDDEKYLVRSGETRRLFVGGTAGQRVARIVYECVAAKNCRQLRVAVVKGAVSCERSAC